VAVALGGSCPGGSGPGGSGPDGCTSRIRFHATAKAKHHFLWIRSKQEVWYDFMNKLFEQINVKHYYTKHCFLNIPKHLMFRTHHTVRPTRRTSPDEPYLHQPSAWATIPDPPPSVNLARSYQSQSKLTGPLPPPSDRPPYPPSFTSQYRPELDAGNVSSSGKLSRKMVI